MQDRLSGGITYRSAGIAFPNALNLMTEYALYRGDSYGRKPLKEIALRDWEKVFTGTEEQCKRYSRLHPKSENHSEILIPSSYVPTDRIRLKSRFRAHIVRINKVLSEGGLHKSFISQGWPRKWLYNLTLSNGTEGLVSHTEPNSPWNPGDEIVYRIKSNKKETIIIIENEHSKDRPRSQSQDR